MAKPYQQDYSVVSINNSLNGSIIYCSTVLIYPSLDTRNPRPVTRRASAVGRGRGIENERRRFASTHARYRYSGVSYVQSMTPSTRRYIRTLCGTSQRHIPTTTVNPKGGVIIQNVPSRIQAQPKPQRTTETAAMKRTV